MHCSKRVVPTSQPEKTSLHEENPAQPKIKKIISKKTREQKKKGVCNTPMSIGIVKILFSDWIKENDHAIENRWTILHRRSKNTTTTLSKAQCPWALCWVLGNTLHHPCKHPVRWMLPSVFEIRTTRNLKNVGSSLPTGPEWEGARSRLRGRVLFFPCLCTLCCVTLVFLIYRQHIFITEFQGSMVVRKQKI